MSSLSVRFSTAVQWNIATSAAAIIIQPIIIAILARLLTPSDFGVYAIANVVIVFALHLSQPGMIAAIVREPILDRKIVGSVVSLSLGISLILAAGCFTAAPLIASGAFQSDPLLVEHLVRLTSITILISGLSLPAQAIMSRELRYQALGLAQLAGIALGTGLTAIVFALYGAGVWSLIIGYLTNATIFCIYCWWN